MIVNSKFSSLYLGRKEEWKAPFDQDVCYIQKYAVGEEMRIQFTGYTPGFTAKYTDKNGFSTPVNVELLHTYEGDENKYLYEIILSVRIEGVYELTLTNGSESAYSCFAIASIDKLNNTVLITYTHYRDEYDTIFVGDAGEKKYFNLRIEGGIYPGDKKQEVSNEMFRDQYYAPHQLSAQSYEVSVLTVGTKKGVPQWVGNRVNNIFKLSEILIDGIETTRNDSSTPELIQVASYYPLYVFKMNIEQTDEERVYMDRLVLGSEKRLIMSTENRINAIQL